LGFWFENIPSGNPASGSQKLDRREFSRQYFFALAISNSRPPGVEFLFYLFIKASTLYPGGIRSHDQLAPKSSVASGDDFLSKDDNPNFCPKNYSQNLRSSYGHLMALNFQIKSSCIDRFARFARNFRPTLLHKIGSCWKLNLYAEGRFPVESILRLGKRMGSEIRRGGGAFVFDLKRHDRKSVKFSNELSFATPKRRHFGDFWGNRSNSDGHRPATDLCSKSIEK
jgi:hypothetical protein